VALKSEPLRETRDRRNVEEERDWESGARVDDVLLG
jgi:hypothetical protein